MTREPEPTKKLVSCLDERKEGKDWDDDVAWWCDGYWLICPETMAERLVVASSTWPRLHHSSVKKWTAKSQENLSHMVTWRWPYSAARCRLSFLLFFCPILFLDSFSFVFSSSYPNRNSKTNQMDRKKKNTKIQRKELKEIFEIPALVRFIPFEYVTTANVTYTIQKSNQSTGQQHFSLVISFTVPTSRTFTHTQTQRERERGKKRKTMPSTQPDTFVDALNNKLTHKTKSLTA